MGLLIDSSIWIAGERHQIDLPELLSHYLGETLAISAVTASELLHGVQRAQGGKPKSGLCCKPAAQSVAHMICSSLPQPWR